MRVGALIPVRLASSRLPGKALLSIGGRPVIAHLLDRVFASRFLAARDVVVCTTEDPTDDRLVPVVESAGASVFRGSRDDLIDRFHSAICAFGFDAVIQVDGDDPFADTCYMDRCLELLDADSSLGIVTTIDLPLGLGSKAFRASAVETVWRHHLTERNDTGFIYYFTRTGLCRVGHVHPVSEGHRHATARVTLDYPEDLLFFRRLFDDLQTGPTPFGVEEIVALLRRRPELLEINSKLSEGYWKRTRQLASLEYEVNGERRKVEV